MVVMEMAKPGCLCDRYKDTPIHEDVKWAWHPEGALYSGKGFPGYMLCPLYQYPSGLSFKRNASSLPLVVCSSVPSPGSKSTVVWNQPVK